jgi:hypothetical protein
MGTLHECPFFFGHSFLGASYPSAFFPRVGYNPAILPAEIGPTGPDRVSRLQCFYYVAWLFTLNPIHPCDGKHNFRGRCSLSWDNWPLSTLR